MATIAVGQIALTDLNDAIISGSAPTNPTIGTLWVDSSVTPNLLKKWDGAVWAVIGEISEEGTGETIEDIQETLGNMANDNAIDFQERQVIKDRLTDILGFVQGDSDTTLPSASTLDNSGKGGFASVRRSARNAGLSTSHSAYTNLESSYNSLKSYLESMTPIDSWDVRYSNRDVVISVTKSTFRDRWLSYYEAVNELAEATSEKLKENVDDIEIGGRNLLLDSDHMFTSTSNRTSPFTETFRPKSSMYEELVGETLTYSMYIDALGEYEGLGSYPNRFGGHGTAEWEDEEGNVVRKFPLDMTTRHTGSGEGKRYSITTVLEPPKGFTKLVNLYMNIQIYAYPTDSNVTWTIGRPKLEKGNKATDWTPAPEDIEDRFDGVESRVTDVESKTTNNAIINTVTTSETFTTVQGTANNAESVANTALGNAQNAQNTADSKADPSYVDGKAGDAERNAKRYTDENSLIDGIPVGGIFTGEFRPNQDTNGSYNDAEIRIISGEFVHPNGNKHVESVNSRIVTGLETPDWRYIMFIGADSSRFPKLYENFGTSSKLFVATKYSDGEWYYDNNDSLYKFTPIDEDCIVGKVVSESGTSEIDKFTLYASKNTETVEGSTDKASKAESNAKEYSDNSSYHTRNMCPTDFGAWESGEYSQSNGEPISSGKRLRLGDLIKVSPSTTYYFDLNRSGDALDEGLQIVVRGYDIDGNFTRNVGIAGNGGTITSSSQEHYFGLTIFDGVNYNWFEEQFEAGNIKPFMCVNSLRDKTFAPHFADIVSKRVSKAEQKITSDAIVSTVTESTEYQAVKNTASSAKSTLDSKASVWDAKETPSGAQAKANSAESSAKSHANSVASTAESNAKSHADTKASTAETNAKNYADKGLLYIKGTGNNNPSNRVLMLNGETIYSGSGRGLQLVVIRRSDLAVIHNNRYDAYNVDGREALANYLSGLSSDVIVTLSSYDAFHYNRDGLGKQLDRCGGSGVDIGGELSHRTPYVLVGIPDIGKSAGLEVYTSADSDAVPAELTTKIVNGVPQGIDTKARELQSRVEKAEQKITSDAIINTVTESSEYKSVENTASNALSNANSAQSTANDAKSKAETAQSTADRKAEEYNVSIGISSSTDYLILLCRADLNGSNNYAIGQLTGKRNSGYMSSGKIDIVFNNSTDGTKPSGGFEVQEVETNNRWSMVTCTYNGQKYVAMRHRPTSEFHVWNNRARFYGMIDSSGEMLKAVEASQVSNIADFKSSQPYNNSIKKYADDSISPVVNRLNEAEQKITPNAITSTVRKSTEYKNDLGEKVGESEIISKINQTAEKIKIQANKIDLIGSVTVLSDIAGNLGDITAGNITGTTIKGSTISTEGYDRLNNIVHLGIGNGAVTSTSDAYSNSVSLDVRGLRFDDNDGYLDISTWYDESGVFYESRDFSNTTLVNHSYIMAGSYGISMETDNEISMQTFDEININGSSINMNGIEEVRATSTFNITRSEIYDYLIINRNNSDSNNVRWVVSMPDGNFALSEGDDSSNQSQRHFEFRRDGEFYVRNGVGRFDQGLQLDSDGSSGWLDLGTGGKVSVYNNHTTLYSYPNQGSEGIRLRVVGGTNGSIDVMRFQEDGVIRLNRDNLSTSSTTSNVRIFTGDSGSSARLGIVTSKRELKQDIEELKLTNEQLLSLTPIRFRDRKEVEENPNEARFYLGLLAEDVYLSGISELSERDEKGNPASVSYERVGVALLPFVQKMIVEIEHLQEEIENLKKERV